MQQQPGFDPTNKKILFISAHPDDADFGASGTFLTWQKQGARGAIVIATNGDKGTNDTNLTSADLAKIRHEEQLAASKLLGLEHTWFLDYPDAHLEISQQLKAQLVKIIREYQPDVVFTFDPTMVYSLKRGSINHPDHRAIGQAALDAVFPMARDFLTFPEHHESGLPSHKVSDVFLYNFESPNFFVDISSVFDQKLAVLKTHKSQVNVTDLEQKMRAWNGELGKTIDVAAAEAFVHMHLA